MTNPNDAQLAAKWSLLVWQVLISCAANRQTIQYGQLAKKIGLRRGGFLIGPYLDRVADYCCCANSLPDLTTLVVNLRTGMPTQARVKSEKVAEERERVFRTEWFKVTPPTLDDLSK